MLYFEGVEKLIEGIVGFFECNFINSVLSKHVTVKKE